MCTKTFFASALLTLCFAGSCAASNGGGHGVGNSIVSAGVSKKMAEPKDDCACADSKDAKAAKDTKAAKDCKCKAKPACESGDVSCKIK